MPLEISIGGPATAPIAQQVAFIRRAERIESEALALLDEVGAATQEAQGTVRISTMSWIFNDLIVPLLPDFFSRYPGISIKRGADLPDEVYFPLEKRILASNRL